MANLNEENFSVKTEEEKLETSAQNIDLSHCDNTKLNPKFRNFTTKPKICSYFFKNGYCKFGNTCKYSHKIRIEIEKHRSSPFVKKSLVVPNNVCQDNESFPYPELQNTGRQIPSNQPSRSNNEISIAPSQYQIIARKFHSTNDRTSKKQSTPLCYYFKRGKCNRGDQCRFYHQNRNVSISENFNLAEVKEDVNYTSHNEVPQTFPDQTATETDKTLIFNKTSNVHDLTSLSKEDTLRVTEIEQLKKRFPHCEEILENETFSFIFQPSDPDWPFDVRKVKIEVHFPKSYPVEKCNLTVIKHAENIPELLIRFLNKAICDWINAKYEENNASKKLELIFRPFLKWLDRNLEDLFISGLRKVKQDLKAKEDGIEFVPVENLFPSSTKDVDSDSSNNKECDDVQKSELIPLLSQTSLSNNKPPPTAKDLNNKQFHYVGNNVMKVLFSELELTEGAAALICTKISVTLQCCRCKSSFHMKSVPKKNNAYVCSKCSKNMSFTLEPCTLHQFSNVLGNLYLLDCLAVDLNLVECQFLVDCLNCSKQVPIDGVHYGQKHKMWCIFCHGKMLMSIGSVKFQTLKQSSISDANYLPTRRIDKKVKDPVVKEGDPLPNFGACKHYKKSFRWLRFPCCGRLYPCDDCHNEKETDHEMKYASRMICGFCSKEQPYSREKPCLLCSQSLTKKSGSHWEGGKGCRNKIQMSREDKHKYAGTCKTVSKKSSSVKTKS